MDLDLNLDDDSPLPKYVQLADQLRARIADGTITGKLPSGNDFVQQYGVGRETAYRAMGKLRDEGIVIVGRGRGFYVAKREQD